MSLNRFFWLHKITQQSKRQGAPSFSSSLWSSPFQRGCRSTTLREYSPTHPCTRSPCLTPSCPHWNVDFWGRGSVSSLLLSLQGLEKCLPHNGTKLSVISEIILVHRNKKLWNMGDISGHTGLTPSQKHYSKCHWELLTSLQECLPQATHEGLRPKLDCSSKTETHASASQLSPTTGYPTIAWVPTGNLLN